ncbi:MAG: hypothetical protein WD077_06660 [Bacteroidia bacterium]
MKKFLPLVLIAIPLLLLSQNEERKIIMTFYAGPSINRIQVIKESKPLLDGNSFSNPVNLGTTGGFQTDFRIWKGLSYSVLAEMGTFRLEGSFVNNKPSGQTAYKFENSFSSNATTFSVSPVGLVYCYPLSPSLQLIMAAHAGILFSYDYKISGVQVLRPYYFDSYPSTSSESEKRKGFVSASTGVEFDLNKRPVVIMVGYRSFSTSGYRGELLWNIGGSAIQYRREMAWIAFGFVL